MDQEFHHLKTLVVQLQTRIVYLEVNNNQNHLKNEEFQKKIETTEKNLTELKDQLKSFQQENMKLNAEVQFNNKKILMLENAQSNDKLLIETLQKQHAKCAQCLLDLDKLSQTVDDKVETNEKHFTEVKKQLETFQKENLSLKNKVDTNDKNILMFENSKNEDKTLIDDLQKQLTNSTSNFKGKLERLSHSTTSLSIKMGEVEEDKMKTVKSFFNAKVLPENQPLEAGKWTRLDKCESVVSYDVHPSMDNGQFVAKEDGIYQLCSRMWQEGNGHLALGLKVEDIGHGVILGETRKFYDTCCGVVMLPLKSGQKVGMSIYRFKGADPKVLECNFMGFLVTPCDVGSLENVIEQQKKCFGLYRVLKTRLDEESG